jgi:WD40 repeat protein
MSLIDGTLVYELALSSNGNYLAGSMTCQTCNTGDVIKIWDIQANSVLTEFEILSDERNPLIWNDSENLLAYMDSRNLFIWDRTTGSETLLVESRSIVDMAWLTDSTLLVADIFGNLLMDR